MTTLSKTLIAAAAFAAAILLKPHHQTVDRFAVGRKEIASGAGIGLQPFAERALHIAAAQEGLPEALGIGWR